MYRESVKMKLFRRGLDRLNAEKSLLFLLLVSLAIKVTLLFSGDVINKDGVRYIEAARQFSQGNFLEALRIDWMPFYSLLISGLHFLIQDWVLAGQLISLFSMVFALVPLYLLTRDIFDDKVAFWTGLAFSLSPMFNDHADGLLRDPIFLFFVAWSVFFCWRALQTKRTIFFILASISAILALFCRLEGILLWGVYLSVLAVLSIKKRSERRLWLKGGAILVGLPLALGLLLGSGMTLAARKTGITSIGPSGELHREVKEVVSENSLAYYKRKFKLLGLENYHSRYKKLKELQNAIPGWDQQGSLVVTTRHYIPIIYLLSVVDAMGKNLFPVYILPLLLGFSKHPARNRGHWLVLVAVGTYFLMAYYFVFIRDGIPKRYVLVPPLFLYPWVGRGLEEIRAKIAECRWRRTALVFFILLFCGLPVYSSLKDFCDSAKGNAIRVAGKWLAEQPDLQNTLIACSDNRVRFYTSPELKFLKKMEAVSVARNYKRMESVALKGNADFLVIRASKKNRQRIPEYKHFSLLKEFMGVKYDVLIYRRNNKV